MSAEQFGPGASVGNTAQSIGLPDADPVVDHQDPQSVVHGRRPRPHSAASQATIREGLATVAEGSGGYFLVASRVAHTNSYASGKDPGGGGGVW